jgi:putative flippase GtrA
MHITRNFVPAGKILQQFLRFAIVGGINTIIDMIVFNLLLYLFPSRNVGDLLLYNTIACVVAATNSFFWNKYWTFKQRQPVTRKELLHFALLTAATVLCNNSIVLILTSSLPSLMASAALGANILRLSAIAGTLFISFFGMRLWVFIKRAPNPESTWPIQSNALLNKSQHSLTVVLPAYNEAAAIAQTIQTTVTALSQMIRDFEIIVVNDGSKDNTQRIVEQIMRWEPHVRLINHAKNQGCGAALVSGFEAGTKELTFYMDSDGQFDIYDLAKFLPLIDEYDAVFGRRIDRQDAWMRKLNAWGWNKIVRFVFGIKVRDIDCAFKLYRSDFFHTHKLEARGAMLLTEMVYKFAHAGYTYTEVGVRHLPRQGGKGTGAKPSVIAHAFKEMFFYANKWYQEEISPS